MDDKLVKKIVFVPKTGTHTFMPIIVYSIDGGWVMKEPVETLCPRGLEANEIDAFMLGISIGVSMSKEEE